jgi:hypothetical protein
MPKLKARAKRLRSMRYICRWQEPRRDTLLLYACFISETADYVLNRLIETTLAKDREFQTWRAARPADLLSSVTRRRCSDTSGDASTQPRA